MKGIRALCLWLLLLPVGGTSAQLVEKVRDILGEDSSAVTTTSLKTDSDSIYLLKARQDLEVARLNEANLRMEIEHKRIRQCKAGG